MTRAPSAMLSRSPTRRGRSAVAAMGRGTLGLVVTSVALVTLAPPQTSSAQEAIHITASPPVGGNADRAVASAGSTLPVASSTAAPAAATSTSLVPTPQTADLSDRVVRASATVTRAGVSVNAIVLAGDGRMFAPLSLFGTENSADVRYPDGRRDTATVQASDVNWGVALLEPRGGHWREGLPLAAASRGNTPVRWVHGAPFAASQGVLRRRRTLVSAQGELLRDAWELDPLPSRETVGSGVVNARGELAAFIVQADPTQNPSVTAPFGVPSQVLRDLLQRAGPSTRPWLGLVARDLRRDEMTRGTRGVRVTDVATGSPAESAGIVAGATGDIITAVDSQPVRSTADIAAALQRHRAGDQLTFRISRRGATTEAVVELGTFPTPP